jgi:membrane protease YdiL (CAAX protease family)
MSTITPATPPPAPYARPRGPRLLLWPFWNAQEGRLRTLWRLVLALVAITAVMRVMVFAGASLGGLALQPTVLRTVGTAIPLLLATWWIDRRTVAHLGLRIDRQWVVDFGFGCLLGVALIALGVGALHAFGWMETEPVARLDVAGIATACLVLLFASFFEELLFRSWLLRNVADGLKFKPLGPRGGLVLGTLLSSALFGYGHANNPGATLVSSLNVAAAGIFLAVPYLITGRLAVSWGVHWTWRRARSSASP